MPENDWDSSGQWMQNWNLAGIPITPTGMLATAAAPAPAPVAVAAPAPTPAPQPAAPAPAPTPAPAPYYSLHGVPDPNQPSVAAETKPLQVNCGASPAPAAAPVQGDPYAMLTKAQFASDYQTPDWYRASGLMLDQSPEKLRAFFQANPQYLQDWQTITSGGKSAYATDGSTLVRSNLNEMPKEIADYYRANPDELLAREGFNLDPTLAYMNYYGGPAALGLDPKYGNIETFMMNHKWTPNGIVANDNIQMYAKTPYGAGTQSLNGGTGLNIGGSASGGATAGAGGGGASGGTSGGGSSGGYSSSTSSASATRAVDSATETIEGRIRNLLATDATGNYTNPLIQQAVESALQQFSGRGLLNSSMASQAAYQAAISKAIEIAGPDAQTYFSQGRANQDAVNVFERDARGYEQEQIKLDKQLAQNATQFEKELAYKYEALKIDASSQAEASRLAREHELIMQENSAVNSAYDLYLRRISDIDANANYDAATKAQMKNAAGKDFDLYAKAKKITWDMNLGDRYGTTT